MATPSPATIPLHTAERVETVWARQGSYLVADIGTPNGRTVSSLWHDDICARDDGSTFTTSGNRQCTPWADGDEWERKSADLDRVVAVLTARDGLIAVLEWISDLDEAVVAELDAASLRNLLRMNAAKARAALARAMKS